MQVTIKTNSSTIGIQQTFTCSKSAIKTLEKSVKWSKLTIETPEPRHGLCSGVFIFNFEKKSTPFPSISFAAFEQVNVFWVFKQRIF